MTAEETTSEFRNAMCRAISLHVMNAANAHLRPRLGDRLDAEPYESMTDERLVAFAEEMEVPAEQIASIVAETSTVRVPVRGEWLCPQCRDSGMVQVATDPDRYGRCPNCNPVPVDEMFNPHLHGGQT